MTTVELILFIAAMILSAACVALGLLCERQARHGSDAAFRQRLYSDSLMVSNRLREERMALVCRTLTGGRN